MTIWHSNCRRPIGSDAAIGVVTTASFALGIALVARYGSPGRSADSLLFGNVLGVTSSDVWLVAGVSLVAVVFILLGLAMFDVFLIGVFHFVEQSAASSLVALIGAAKMETDAAGIFK